jgi:hypothetical protein
VNGRVANASALIASPPSARSDPRLSVTRSSDGRRALRGERILEVDPTDTQRDRLLVNWQRAPRASEYLTAFVTYHRALLANEAVEGREPGLTDAGWRRLYPYLHAERWAPDNEDLADYYDNLIVRLIGRYGRPTDRRSRRAPPSPDTAPHRPLSLELSCGTRPAPPSAAYFATIVVPQM